MTEEEILISIERAIVSLDIINADITRILDAGWGDSICRTNLQAARAHASMAEMTFKIARERGLD